MFNALKKLFSPPAQRVSDLNPKSPLVFDATNIITKPIPNRPETKVEVDTKWLNILSKSFGERKFTAQSEQIRLETEKLYCQLAEVTNSYLEIKGSSIAQELRTSQFSYYGNIPYTLYCIAEGEITRGYHPSDGYDPNFSYSLIIQRYGQDLVDRLGETSTKYVKRLPLPSAQTQAVLNLTAKGLPIYWWDSDGFVRQQYSIDTTSIKMLNRSVGRNTVFWLNNAEVRYQIIQRYLASLKLVIASMDNPSYKWAKIHKIAIASLSRDKNQYIDYAQLRLPAALLKVAEQYTREAAIYAHSLNIDQEVSYIKRSVPQEIFDELMGELRGHGLPQLSSSTYSELRATFTSSIKVDSERLPSLSESEIMTLFNEYEHDPSFSKFCEAVLKIVVGKATIRLVALYYIVSLLKDTEQLRPSYQRVLESIVHPKQIDLFYAISKGVLPLIDDIYSTMHQLIESPKKYIKLNTSEISAIRQNHEVTESLLSEYLGDSDSKEIYTSETTASPTKNIPTSLEEAFASDLVDESVAIYTDDEAKLISLLCSLSGKASREDVDRLIFEHGRPISAIINDINKKAYRDLEDQLIILSDDTIYLDPDYIKYAKEHSNS
jgi:hypothetical protein